MFDQLLHKRGAKHPVLNKKHLTLGQKMADKLTASMGSWTFIIIFLLFLVIWMFINAFFTIRIIEGEPFDPYPFILLNLVLSCLAAIQAPIILMSQNRESQKDRLRLQYDYNVNKKAEKEIREIQAQLKEIKKIIRKK